MYLRARVCNRDSFRANVSNFFKARLSAPRKLLPNYLFRGENPFHLPRWKIDKAVCINGKITEAEKDAEISETVAENARRDGKRTNI